MLPDSMNVSVIADNIRAIWDRIKDISGHILPATTSATTGQILKLTGENKTPTWEDEYSYTPPAYSETEINTGRKWIDGKDIYAKTFTGTTTSSTTDKKFADTGISSDCTIIDFKGLTKQGNIIGAIGYYIEATNRLQIYVRVDSGEYKIMYITGSSFLYGTTIVTVYYTKPDPTPEPETRVDDPLKDVTNYVPEQEPETKTTRKKTSK